MANLEHQMRRRDKEMIPRTLVIAMFTLMAFSVALVAVARLSDRPLVGTAAEADVAAEQLILLTGGRGEFTVAIGDTVLLDSTEAGLGFVSAVGRSLAYTRNSHGADAGAPVRLIQRTDGRLALVDTVSPWTVELSNYGAASTDLFLNLLPKEEN